MHGHYTHPQCDYGRLLPALISCDREQRRHVDRGTGAAHIAHWQYEQKTQPALQLEYNTAKEASAKIVFVDNPNWRTLVSMCMQHIPDSSFPVLECKNIEGVCFKFQNANLYVTAPKKCRFQAAHAIFEAPEGSNTTVCFTWSMLMHVNQHLRSIWILVRRLVDHRQ
jgi:hypothetical protein